MIKFRGQRVDNGELVEGLLSSIFVDPTPITGEKDVEVRTAIKSNPYSYENARNYEIHPSTLQVMTTDGWADIADVEVVRKKAANDYKCSTVIFFKLKDGKYVDDNGNEITTEFLFLHKHAIFHDSGYVVLK